MDNKKKILLIGDSIRMGYDKYVKEHLKDSCEVYFPAENCQFAQYVLRHLGDWKASLKLDETLDLVHFNVGHWDTLEFYDDGCLTPIDMYAFFLDKICKRIRRHYPNAKVVFATSTPVIEERFLTPHISVRRNETVKKYNEVAKEIVVKHGFIINDLYPLLENAPKEYYSDMTHLYTPEGTQVLADAVLKVICRELNMEYKNFTLTNYSEIKEVIGI